ncbi:unnamed protein product, partial [Ilex paraguariensis]
MANKRSNHGVVVVIQGEMEDEVDVDVEMLGTSIVAARASMVLSDVGVAMAEEQIVMVHDGRAAHVLGEQGGIKERTKGAHCIGRAGAATVQEKELGALGADSNRNLSATLGAGLDSHLGTTLAATLNGLGEHNVRVMGQRCGQRKVLASGVLGSPLGKGKEREEETLGAASTCGTVGRAAQALGEHGDSLGEPEAGLGPLTSQG